MAKDFNHPRVVHYYDEHIRLLIPGYDLVHLQIQAILKTNLNNASNHGPDNLSNQQRKILIAGCGTGFELEYLIQHFPQASFVAFDPAEAMINQAKQRFNAPEDVARIEFLVGDSSVLHGHEQQFDVALGILVSHFLSQTEKKKYFKEIQHSLKNDGFLLSYDLMQFQDQAQIQQLQYLTQSLGLSEKKSQIMVERLNDDFQLISIQDLQQLLRNSGFNRIECFSQILSFYGVLSYK